MGDSHYNIHCGSDGRHSATRWRLGTGQHILYLQQGIARIPLKDCFGISIYTKDRFWDPNVKLSKTGGFVFNIDGHIDGAPFHDYNANRIYMQYRGNLRIYLKNQYNH